MRHRRLPSLALLAAGVLATVPATTQVANAAVVYGPSVPYTKILNGQFRFVALPGSALIDTTSHGYVYKAGKQDSHLVVTQVERGLRFHDSGTSTFKSLPDTCQREAVPTGVAAVCSIPGGASSASPMLVEIWPRLGDDYVDAGSLSDTFDVTVLADAGADVVRTGAGNDFVNGAFQDDWVSSGAGNDWVRTGDGRDTLLGDGGNDKLVGSADEDVLHGGSGDDVTYGGAGSDALWAEAGRDLASCGDGSDGAFVDGSDRTSSCESVAGY